MDLVVHVLKPLDIHLRRNIHNRPSMHIRVCLLYFLKLLIDI